MLLNKWINEAKNIKILNDSIEFDVLPKTDIWQITHYGFSRTDGNCYTYETNEDLCLTVKVSMNYIEEFDQAGIIVFIDEENFAKLCVENQLNTKNKLGSVVCKDKRSDWATQNIENIKDIYYRVSKRGINYLFEYSFDNKEFIQCRLFDLPCSKNVSIGVFGASPLGNGFKACFDHIKFSDNKWKLNLNDLPDNFK